MWSLVLLLDLLGPKKFLRFLAGSMLITLFFLYCFVHEGFDHPRPMQHTVVRVQRWPLPAATPDH